MINYPQQPVVAFKSGNVAKKIFPFVFAKGVMYMDMQTRADTCAICSQKYILSSFGIDLPESDLIKDAAINGEYALFNNWGTNAKYVGNILERNGIGVHKCEGSMEDLISELTQGHKVIVGIDSNEIFFANNDVTRAVEQYKDVFAEKANHAVVVVNANTDYVNILDPADGKFKRVDAETFLDAWHDSKCFLLATDQSPEEYFQAQSKPVYSKEKNIMDNAIFDNLGKVMGKEYIDVQAVHTTEDGNIYAVEADTTGNRQADMIAVDTTGDGHFDLVALDTTGDGNFDTQSLDLSGNGTPDIVAQDLNGDGIPDAYLVDTNGDGQVDAVGVDRDADGFIDDIAPLG